MMHTQMLWQLDPPQLSVPHNRFLTNAAWLDLPLSTNVEIRPASPEANPTRTRPLAKILKENPKARYRENDPCS